jgi:cysteine dioxygenase
MQGRRQLLSLFRRWDRREVPISTAELIAALESLRIGRDDLADAIGFDDGCYRRNIIHSRPHYQALVLCWRSGQRSPIHDHRGSNCVVRVIAGRASETRFGPTPSGRLVPMWSHEHLEGSTSACCGDEIHQMGNYQAPGQDLITLHLYTPPPAAWRFYEVKETTLAGHDRLIRKPARTVRIELGHLSGSKPMGRKVRGGAPCPS